MRRFPRFAAGAGAGRRYTEADVDALVEATLPQHRVTKLCPRPFTREDLRAIFLDSLELW